MSADDVSATGASRSADLLQDIQQRYPTVYRRRQQRYARQQALNISKTVSDHELHVHFKDEKEDPRVDVASNPQTPRTPADCSRLNNLDDSDVVLDASNQRDIPYSGNTIKKTNLHPNQTESVFTGNAKKILDPLCSNSRDPHYRTKPIIGGECLSSANEYPDLQKANGLKYHHLPKSAAPRHSIQDRLQKNAEMLNSLLYRKPPFFSQRKHQQSPSAVDSPENGLGEKMSAYPCGENSLVCNGKHSTAPPSGSSSNTRISSKMSSLEQDYSSDPKDDENEDQVHKSKVNKSFTEMCQSLCEQQKCKSNICSPELCVSCMSAGYDSGVSKCTCSNLSAHLDSPCDSAIDVESTSIQSTVSLEKLSVQIPKTDLEGSDGPLPRFDGISHLPKMPDNQVKISTWQVEPVDFQWIQHNDCNGDGSRGRCFSEMNGRQVHTQRLGEISASDDTTSRYHADREFTDLSSSSLSSFQGSTVRDDLSIRSVSSMFTDSDICSNTPRSIYTPRSNISTSGGTPRRIAMKWRVQSAASKHVSVEDSGHSSEKELEEIFFLPGHRQATGYAFSTPRSYHLSDDCDDTDDTDPRCGITPGPLQRGHATAENTRQKKKHYIVKRPQSTPLFGSAESTSFDNRILDENQNNRSVFIAHSTESVPGALECLSESKCDNSRNYNTKCQTAMVPKKGNTNAHGERLTNQISFGSSQTDKGASQKSSGKELLGSLSNEIDKSPSTVNTVSKCWYSSDDRDIEFFMQAEFFDASMKPKKSRLKRFLKKKKGKYNPMLQEPPMKGDLMQRPVSMPNLLFDDTFVRSESKSLNKSFDELRSVSTVPNGNGSILSEGDGSVLPNGNISVLPQGNESILPNGNGCVLSSNNDRLYLQDTLPRQKTHTYINVIPKSKAFGNACKPTFNTSLCNSDQRMLHGKPMSVSSQLDIERKVPSLVHQGVGSEPESCSNVVLTSSKLADPTVCVRSAAGDLPYSVNDPSESDGSSSGWSGRPHLKCAGGHSESGGRSKVTEAVRSGQRTLPVDACPLKNHRMEMPSAYDEDHHHHVDHVLEGGSVALQLSSSLLHRTGRQYINGHDDDDGDGYDDAMYVNTTHGWSNASNCGSETNQSSLYTELGNTSQEMSELDTSGLSSKTFVISHEQSSPTVNMKPNVVGRDPLPLDNVDDDVFYANCFMNDGLTFTKGSDFSEVADCYPATTKQDVSRLVEHGEDNEQVIKEGNRTHHLKADPFHADVGENDFSSARKRIQSFSYPCISSNLGFSRNSAKGSQCHPAQKRTQSLSCPSTPSHYQDLERSNCAGQISQLLFDLKNELIGHDTDAVSVQSEYSTTDDDNRGRESTGLEDDYVNIRRASDSEGERDPTACDQVERKSEDSDTACSAAVENSNCSIYIDVDSRTIEQTVTLKEPHSAAHSVTAVKKPVKKIRTIFKTSQSSVDSEESMKTMEDPYSEVENSNAPVTGGGVQNGTPPRVSLYATCEDVIPDHLSGNNNHTEDWNRTRGVQSYNGSQTSDIYENISDYCDGDTTMVKPGVIPKTVQDDSVAPPVASRRSVVYNCGENMTDPAYQKAEVEDDYAVVTKPRSGSALRVVDKPVVDKGDHCGVEGACGGEQDEDFCPPVPDRCYKKNSSIPLKASTEFGGSGSSLFDKVGCTFKSMKKAISMDRGMDHIGKEEKKRNKENKKERTDKLLMSKGPSLKSFTSFFSRKKPPRISSTGDACVDTAVQDPPSKDGKLKKCHKYLKRKSKPMPSKETVESPKEFRQLGKLIGINPDGSQLVELKKPPNGPIGFYIARGTANYDYGLLVSRFTTENPEKLFAGILGVGDEILEVNEKPVKDLTLEQVYELMAASDKLILKVFPLFARKDV
ncbi:uncharacterized protein LOC121384160 isoform X1 [Gigantopelta aegis]|uniref:uncharacterized protein LOC121384160 isoform X1 n=1 Tax=Gigantopelta aegis TaxID=1735272 RepID=UPI001B88BF4D|nr:uncharacterized protein LOC121384160 isoform X1 [Gigantopelta aegis]